MIYDFPLNEKSRTYLRLESLFSQIRDNLESDQSWAHIAFFKGLFDLQELLERGDLRADLIKDLERLGQRLSHWASLPDVDLEQIQRMQQESTQLSRSLLSSPRPGARLKEDRLLGSIRQRFSIPGGLCAFDVPQLHHWLVTPAVGRHQQMQQWLAPRVQVVNICAHFQKAPQILIRGSGCVLILQCARTVESVISVIGSIHLLRVIQQCQRRCLDNER